MLQNLRRHAAPDQGFTLIEILVVILIIGILAAVAIPAFLNQRGKAYDAAAKSDIMTANTAMQTYATDNGKYPASVNTANGSSDPLVSIEPALGNKPYVTGGSTATGFTLTAVASGTNPDTFTFTNASDAITRACTGSSGGCVGGSW